ncbi:Type I restriction-modification system methyltransferase and restriction endonuclease [Methanonatronarchaeum thermophilum]|uniref:site-specific DNA-methyltransferase (adenine-specific) n=1 Tax=Methanonatronarchaeum thermophilum TaxID=1927129 RepID=A0A1Y3GCK3_9EURY|nr:Type I restriction-modification system methyltransferase and restriction endonuclease [Methanonatronarchaeum thermophilum]
MTEQGIKKIVKTYREKEEEKHHSRIVELGKIKENDYNLNIGLYVDTTEPQENIDVTKELKKLKKLQQERQKIEKQMKKHMEALNYE